MKIIFSPSKTMKYKDIDLKNSKDVEFTNHTKALIEKLKSFSFKRHHKYNLPDNILKKVELFIHKRAEISLKYLNEKI